MGLGRARGRARWRVDTARLAGGGGRFAPKWCGRFKRPVARFWYWPIRWPTRGLFLALLAHFGALLGLCCWLAMLGRAREHAACLFSLDECTVLGAHTVCLAYGLAYVLAYGIARAWPALGVRLGLAGGLLQRLPKQATRRGKVAMLSIHRIMKPC